MPLVKACEKCGQKCIKKLDVPVFMELYDRITQTPLQVSVSVLAMVKAETL